MNATSSSTATSTDIPSRKSPRWSTRPPTPCGSGMGGSNSSFPNWSPMQDEAEPLFLKYLEAAESGKPPATTQAPYNNPEFLKILPPHTRINRAIHCAGEELNP